MNSRTDSVLRSLDASAAALTTAEQVRAAETLERILAATPSTEAVQPAGPAPHRRSRRRLALVPGAAILLIVCWAVLLQGTRGGNAAYASWTAIPASVASDELHAAATACRDKLHGFSINADRAKLVLAERRGDYIALLYRTDNPDMSGACLVHNPKGSTDVDYGDMGVGVGGSSGPALNAPPRGYTQGGIFGSRGASITDGAVGDAVTGVTIHAGALTVKASVRNGRYVAWWPGPAFENGPRKPSGEAGPLKLVLSYDLTLADGSVIHNAQPTLPS
jgi:hypothetical protein